LALDHRHWFVPVAFGVIILGHWYFVEREPDGVPPDESDILHRGEHPPKWQESSTSFDLPDIAPFLQLLLPHIAGGYTAKVAAHIADLAARMKHEEERSLEYDVVFQGQRIPLNIGLFKDDIDEITVCFRTLKPLADFIDSEMASFFAERGM
jgi:hypothetical protein